MQYSLSQLMHVLKSSFDEIFWEFDFWFVSEVVKCKKSWKATFLELVEYNAQWEIIAKCSASIFGTHVLDAFSTATKLSIDDIVWQKILCRWKFGNKDDRIYINISEISSSFTLGALKQAQSNILDILIKEWILTKNKNTRIPIPPYNIAVISSDWSEWLRDFYSSLDDAKIPYTPYLYNTAVHWNAAKEWVHKALQTINTDIEWGKDISLICIIRWWGEAAWIVRQNDLDIARGICHMPVPVIVAVWHTNDTSVLEQISFWYAKTPTAAAHFLIDQYTMFAIDVKDLYQSILDTVTKKTQEYIHTTNAIYEKITFNIWYSYKRIGEKIESLYAIITKYHPQHILERGYALIRYQDGLDNGIPNIGSHIEIETNKTYITATVESVATKE